MKYLIGIMLTVTTVYSASDPIPAGFRIDWDPGVRGGIPYRTTIYTNMATTNSSAIQTALNNCPSNQVVKLMTNTYWMDGVIKIPTGVTLRGSGVSNTVLMGTAAHGDDRMIEWNNTFDTEWTQPSRNLTGTINKGDTNLTTSVAHGWAVNDIVLIDMLEDPAGNPPIDNGGSLGTCTWCGRGSGVRPIGQWVQILSVPTSTTATFTPPLYWTYTNSPQGIEMTGLTKLAGLEDLSINNTNSQAQDVFGIFGAISCWMTNVQWIGVYRYSTWGYGALWFTIQRCHGVGGIPVGADRDAQYTSSRSYGPFLGPHFCAGLITDNVFEKFTMGWAFEGASAGNVCSYNLITNIWWRNDSGTSPRRFGPLMHGPHPFMNLVEGNYSACRIRHDEYWGTSSHFTYLRNRIIQVDRGAGDDQTSTVEFERKNWYMSVVGNILGDNTAGGAEVNYEYLAGETRVSDNPTIWVLAYNSIGVAQDNSLSDTNMLATLIRWKNWCYRTNDSISGSGVTYHTNNIPDPSDTTTLTNSYYLFAKPSYFGGLEWPPYDPSDPTDNSATNIPAGHRYYLGTEAPADSGESSTTGPVKVEMPRSNYQMKGNFILRQ